MNQVNKLDTSQIIMMLSLNGKKGGRVEKTMKEKEQTERDGDKS